MSAGDYDPDLRRETPLAVALKARIRDNGPITIASYMHACLLDPDHGYYRTRPAIGGAADFVTAPEISQIFGELVGLWAAIVWQQMGAPRSFNLVELGPGRGTLLCDALTAASIVPGFVAAAELRLVETNVTLKASQRGALERFGRPIGFCEHLNEVAPAPSIVIANEFLDALPVAQMVKGDPGWFERGVTLDAGGKLQFALLAERPQYFCQASSQLSPASVVLERRNTMDYTFGLLRLASGGPLAALFIDYGHTELAIGDTLQAVRNHRYEHPLTSPGEADLTAQVDFGSFATEAGTWQLATNGPVTQAEFLGALGIIERASRLMSLNPTRAGEVEAGVARLIAPNGMGSRFKAIGIFTPQLGRLPGFPVVDSRSQGK